MRWLYRVLRQRLTLHTARVHIAAEPDGADHFDALDIWPDTPECRAFLDEVRAVLLDEELYYAPPLYRDPVTGEMPEMTEGQRKWVELRQRMQAFRATLPT